MKRGQVTLLVIIGLILLFSVSILLYFSRISITNDIQSRARETVNEFVESNSLSQYISICLNRVASEGLDLLGKQGGVIYEHQGGLTPDPNMPFDETHIFYQGNNVVYAINDIDQTLCSSYRQHNPQTFNIDQNINWEYPVLHVPFQEFYSRFTSTLEEQGCFYVGSTKNLRKSGYLGFNSFPHLCTQETAEDMNNNRIPIARQISCTNNFQESILQPDNEYPSIETQLEYYIKENMLATSENTDGCFDRSIYETVGDEIVIDVDNFDVDVYFTEPRGVLLQATFPFEVSVEGRKPIVELVNFQQQIDINFIEMYRFLYELVEHMAKDPYFNLHDNNYQEWESYKGKGFSIELLDQSVNGQAPQSQFPLSRQYDDILRLTNTENLLEGEPYVFQVALRQRRPVLDFISQAQFPFKDKNGNDIFVDFLLYPGQPLEFKVEATDPNYDSYAIEFFGWKQTTDSYFDVQCCVQSASCNLNNYRQCLIDSQENQRLILSACRESGMSCSREDFENGNLPDELFLEEGETYIPNILYEQYINNDGFIYLEVDETDSGLHEILITVTDEHGAVDFQRIYVLVYDIPIARLTPKNIYDDIQDEYASIEDPYLLDPSGSQASAFNDGGDISSWVYRLYYDGYDENEDQNQAFDEEYISITNEPFVLPATDYRLATIKNEVFVKDLRELLQEDEPLELDASLEVRQNIANGLNTPPSIPNIKTINLYECLPHGFDSTNVPAGSDLKEYYDTSGYPLPYYSRYLSEISEEEKFLMPHVCCEPTEGRFATPPHAGGHFAETDEICFEGYRETCYPPLDANEYNSIFLAGAVTEDQNGNLIPLKDGGTDFSSYPVNPTLVPANSPFPDGINDVFSLTQEQFCSGSRGNVCSGDVKLSWGLIEECSDLDQSINQYARCEGPGLVSVYTNKNSCYIQGRTGVECKSYSGRANFEQRVLRVGLLSSQGHTMQRAELIGQGFCAGPQQSRIERTNTAQNIVADSAGPFECYGTCVDTTGDGSCAYTLRHCFCPETTACGDGDISMPFSYPISAQDFSDESILFSCNPNSPTTTACSSSCQPSPPETIESCYCELKQGITTDTRGVKQSDLDSFQGYFGDKGADWNRNGACCKPGIFAVFTGQTGSGPIETTTCFDGLLLPSQTSFAYPSGESQERFLSYQGEIYYCSETQTDDFVILRNTEARTFVVDENIFYASDYSDSPDPNYVARIGNHICTQNGWIVN